MILFIFPSTTFGGHEKMASIMIKSLIKGGIIPIQCIISDENDLLSVELQAIGANFTTAVFPSSKLDLILGYFSLRLIRAFYWTYLNINNNTHVILVNGNVVANHRISLAVALYCRIVGRRCSMYLPMIHTSEELDLPYLKGLFYRIAMNRSLCSVTDIWTIDKVWADRILSVNSYLKTYVIQNLVSPINRSKAIVKLSSETNICLVGRLEKKQKGLDLLIAILSKLNSSKLVMIHIVGDGPDSLWLKDALSKIKDSSGNKINYVFYGWINNPQEIIASCSALILPSRVEGIPLVVIEALMLQLEVFAFRIPGLTNFRESIHLVTPFCLDEFADMLNKFIIEPYYFNNQSQRLETLFNCDRFTDELASAISG